MVFSGLQPSSISFTAFDKPIAHYLLSGKQHTNKISDKLVKEVKNPATSSPDIFLSKEVKTKN